MESQKHLLDRRDFLSKSTHAALLAFGTGSLLGTSSSFAQTKSSGKNDQKMTTAE